MRAAYRLAFGLVCSLFPGCGPSDAVWVTLELQKGGKPYVAPENQSVQVTFYGMERKDRRFPARASKVNRSRRAARAKQRTRCPVLKVTEFPRASIGSRSSRNPGQEP